MEVGSSLNENLTDGDDTQVDGSSFKCDQEQWAEKIFRRTLTMCRRAARVEEEDCEDSVRCCYVGDSHRCGVVVGV